MTISDLDINLQERLLKERGILYKKWHKNNSESVIFTNIEGTRYLYAYRSKSSKSICGSKIGNKWIVRYGAISLSKNGNDYEWVRSAKTFTQAANGANVPKYVKTKEDVITIAQSIGILVIDI